LRPSLAANGERHGSRTGLIALRVFRETVWYSVNKGNSG
jgi:hypothetical protein